MRAPYGPKRFACTKCTKTFGPKCSWDFHENSHGVSLSCELCPKKSTKIFSSDQWRIQDFPEEGAPTPRGGGRQHTILSKFPKNCMKLKEFGPPGGRVPCAPLRSATGDITLNQYIHGMHGPCWTTFCGDHYAIAVYGVRLHM